MFQRQILIGTIALTIISLVAVVPALADGPVAVAWLKEQQNADGGFGSPESSVGATADALLAVAATGDSALDWSTGGKTPYGYLKANAGSIAKAGDAAKVVLALIALGENPRDLQAVDLVSLLEGMVGSDGKLGGDSGFINEHSYALIALSSAGRPVPAASVTYLLERQVSDGTWSWNGDTTAGSGDNNTAAMAVIALIAAGVPADNEQIQKTLIYFREQQNEDGGFPYVKPSPWGTSSDSNSTSVVMWAILAAGQDPAGADWKFQGQDGRSALDKLRSFQNDSGAFRWQDAMPEDNFASTVQAVIAGELKTLPFAFTDVGEATRAEVAPPATLPETGVSLWPRIVALLGAGLALIGSGLVLRRRPSTGR